MLKDEINEIHKLVTRISGVKTSAESKKDAIISSLLTIEKELIRKNKQQKENENRINEIIKVVMEMAKLNYNKKAVVSNNLDHFDALAIGINMLGEELQSSTISLKEKEILIKEIHHRIKNNLQVIVSLLSLQMQSIVDPYSLEKFKEAQNRVHAMTLVHEKLYKSKNLSQIDFAEYLRDFIEAINRSNNMTEGRVNLHVNMNIDKGNLKIDMAIPCALILNELISNCFKHAFPDQRKGNIYLDIKTKQNESIIRISDDGVGIPDNMNDKEFSSLGLQLVAMMVEQIGGELTILSNDKTTFIVKFNQE